MDTEKWTARQDGSIPYRDLYDLTYNVNDYSDYKQAYPPTGVNELSVNTETELGSKDQKLSPSDISLSTHYIHPVSDNQPSSWNYSPSKGSYYPPPSSNYQSPSNNYYPPLNTNHQSPIANYYPPSIITDYQPHKNMNSLHPSPQQKVLVPIPNKSAFEWSFMGKLALVKLMLAKLKSFGMINVILFLLIKLKLFLIAIMLKFLFLLKFIKFFKIVMSPLVILPFLTTLLSTPMQSLKSMFSKPLSSTATSAAKIPSVISSIPGEISSANSQSNLVDAIPSTLVNQLGTNNLFPSRADYFAPNRPGALPHLRPPDEETMIENDVSFRAYDTNTLNLLNGRYNKSLGMNDFVLNIFRHVLDSEKCVEIIACRIAVAEKAGTLPLWINR